MFLVVPLCYVLMVGGALSIIAGICLADKIRERKLARMSEVAEASHKFRT